MLGRYKSFGGAAWCNVHNINLLLLVADWHSTSCAVLTQIILSSHCILIRPQDTLPPSVWSALSHSSHRQTDNCHLIPCHHHQTNITTSLWQGRISGDVKSIANFSVVWLVPLSIPNTYCRGETYVIIIIHAELLHFNSILVKSLHKVTTDQHDSQDSGLITCLTPSCPVWELVRFHSSLWTENVTCLCLLLLEL